jgi:hypothetical protein
LVISESTLLGTEYQDLQTFKKNLISYNLFTKSKKIIKTDISFGLKLQYNGCVIMNEGWHILKSLSLETGKYLWEVDLGKYSTTNEEVRIREILGIWENQLVVLMNNNDIVVQISLSTGQIIAENRHILAHLGGARSFGWYFYLEGGYVYLLQQSSYIRINLSNQVIETLWEHENSRYTIQRVSYDEQYAYFMGSNGNNVQPDILGVFDRKALKIVWQHDQPIYSSQPPQSDGDKLYCLDIGGTLHIFEK